MSGHSFSDDCPACTLGEHVIGGLATSCTCCGEDLSDGDREYDEAVDRLLEEG